MPDARRRSRVRSGRRGRRRRRGRGRREEGGTAHAGRLRAPHLLVGARPLAGSLWSATRSSCPWAGGSSGPADAAPAATRDACPAPTSCDLCRNRQGQKKVRRKDGQTTAVCHESRNWLGRTPYLYYIPRGAGPAARRGGRGAGTRNCAAAARGAGWSRGGDTARPQARAAPSSIRAGHRPLLSVLSCSAPASPGARQTLGVPGLRPPPVPPLLGPGWVGEGHSRTPESRGLLPRSAPPPGSCTCRRLRAPRRCGCSSGPSLSFQASPVGRPGS